MGGFIGVCDGYYHDGTPCGLELVKGETVSCSTHCANRGGVGEVPR